jgi:riboflavin synthase
MFTGIIQATGTVCALSGDGMHLQVEASDMDWSDVAIGDSIAVNGVCLTVVARRAVGFDADLSKETLSCVCPFKVDVEVNLEKALRLSDRLGGHLVSGHVDGVGTVVAIEAFGDNRVVSVRVPVALARYFARKGSIAVDGVSLTVNVVGEDFFSVNLIPHTLSSTNFKYLARGSQVNLEVDMLARYVERLTLKVTT